MYIEGATLKHNAYNKIYSGDSFMSDLDKVYLWAEQQTI